MKKQFLLLIAAGLFFSTISNAQIKKGAIFLGGDIGGSSQKTVYNNGVYTNKQNGLVISPVFGKAIKENLVFGGNLSIDLYNNKNTNQANENKQKSYGAGAFLRKYKPLGKSGFYLFLQGNLGYTYYDSETNPNDPLTFSSTKRNTVSVNVYPGISYAVSKKLHLEAGLNNLLSLNYFGQKDIQNGVILNTDKIHSFNVSGSIDNPVSLYVGFRVLIN